MKFSFVKLVANFVVFVVCLILSFVLCFLVFDDIFLFISSSAFGFIVLRIFFAIILFVISKLIISRQIDNRQLTLLFIAYSLLIVSLTLFKTYDLTVSRGYNLNPLNVFNDINTSSGLIMSIGNTLAYIPIGLYIKNLISKKSDTFLVFMFVIYCTSIEVIQYITHFGVADIDDIILNTLGFFCGIKILKICKKRSKKILKGDSL